MGIFILGYALVALFMIVQTFLTHTKLYAKFFHSLVYIVIAIMQIYFALGIEQRDYKGIRGVLSAVVLTAVMLVPFIVTRYFFYKSNPAFYIPNPRELKNITYSQLKNDRTRLIEIIDGLYKTKRKLTRENFAAIFRDMPRHNSFDYVNNGSLTEKFFADVTATADNGYVYLVISSTGSPASEVISAFTQKKFNHASLAFEPELETIISYNGGENVYPPGLNREMLHFFRKKSGASVLVYRLRASREQKLCLIEQLKRINSEGSSYNFWGLILKHSYKPNILYCSQFVYKMLEIAGLAYFDIKPELVKPTDFIELDYYRKLEFECEIKL